MFSLKCSINSVSHSAIAKVATTGCFLLLLGRVITSAAIAKQSFA